MPKNWSITIIPESCVLVYDENFLISVEQKVVHKSDKELSLTQYGRINRTGTPKTSGFYILHEGLLGVFDEQLVEKDYEDIEEKKYSISANSGWLGITDKYWISSLIPEKNKKPECLMLGNLMPSVQNQVLEQL